jgi:hypothetical protein
LADVQEVVVIEAFLARAINTSLATIWDFVLPFADTKSSQFLEVSGIESDLIGAFISYFLSFAKSGVILSIAILLFSLHNCASLWPTQPTNNCASFSSLLPHFHQ